MDHEIHENSAAKTSTHNAFILQFRIMTEVDQQAKFVPGSFQIVVDLGTVLIGELRYGLDFQNNLIKANKVRHLRATPL